MLKPAASRLVFIDGLRGIAAMAVLLFHVAKTDFFVRNPGWIAEVNRAAAAIGFLGVEIFFVISGFVIAYSLRNAEVTAGYVLRFAVRRSLRLDPPYWATLALAALSGYVLTRFFHASSFSVPDGDTVMANLFYVQGILGKPQIVLVFWTLCYEIQFYLLFITLMHASQRWLGGRGMTTALIVTAAGSLLWYVLDPVLGGWCIPCWYLFALGALICRGMLKGKMRISAVCVVMVLGVGFIGGRIEPVAGAACAATLVAAVRLEGLWTWLSGSVVQYLGRISYSLYLTHLIALRICSVVLTHVSWGGGMKSVPAYVGMITMALVCADLFYRTVERPSHALAKRFGRRQPEIQAVVVPVVERAI